MPSIEYMSNLFNHRHEAYDLVDPLDDINGTRDGILLNVVFHRLLDRGEIAFLKVGELSSLSMPCNSSTQ